MELIVAEENKRGSANSSQSIMLLAWRSCFQSSVPQERRHFFVSSRFNMPKGQCVHHY